MLSKYFVLFMLFPTLSYTQLHSQEYFGKFSVGPKGEFEEGTPWTTFVLSEQFFFDDPNGLRWEVPIGTKVNGASIPPAFWSLIGGPFTGRYFKASVVHDHYTQKKSRTAHDTHRNFFYGMRANGVPTWKAKLMYWAVRTFGGDWIIKESVEQVQICDVPISSINCETRPVVVTKATYSGVADLEDPQKLAFALAKFSAVARTLKTSNGEVLDSTINGEVSADLESIDSYSSFLRSELVEGNFEQSEDLGLLSSWANFNFENVEAWENNQIPLLGDLPRYRISSDPSPNFQNQNDLNSVAEAFDFPSDAFLLR